MGLELVTLTEPQLAQLKNGVNADIYFASTEC